MVKKHKQQSEKGFTLVELLLSLAVFSLVLVFVTTTFLQIFRTYSRGITRKEVNQSARLLLEDMVTKLRTVESPNQVDISQINKGRICAGGYSYVWNPVKRPAGWTDNRVYGQVVNIVRIDGDNGMVACNPSVTNITVGSVTSMFTDRVGVIAMSMNPVGQVPDLYQIGITASTSQLDLLDVLNKCTTKNIASSYCAQVSLQAIAGLRNR